MTSSAIVAHSLSKAYDLGERNALSFLGRTSKAEKFWALRDISFEIREHEAVGIIGANGAGKSTLLKILSRVTAPTAGSAQIRGRMGTILEVGTGFHPELTGRENIYLSGTILGMRKSGIDRRFDEIVDFAGVEKFVDTPVKRYSSGMYVRLAFAVAAHLDPDILIVDEVLAVGDVSFQKKCLSKMEGNINQQGQTIIFVSHNMQAIRSLCPRALMIEKGCLVADGPVNDVLTKYSSGQQTSFAVRDASLSNRLNRTRGNVRMTEFSISRPGKAKLENWSFHTGEKLNLCINYDVYDHIASLDLLVQLKLAGTDQVVTTIKEVIVGRPLKPGDNGEITIEIPKLPFRAGEFELMLGLGSSKFAIFEDILDANVNLPHITVEPLEDSLFGLNGLVSIDYGVRHSERVASGQGAVT